MFSRTRAPSMPSNIALKVRDLDRTLSIDDRNYRTVQTILVRRRLIKTSLQFHTPPSPLTWGSRGDFIFGSGLNLCIGVELIGIGRGKGRTLTFEDTFSSGRVVRSFGITRSLKAVPLLRLLLLLLLLDIFSVRLPSNRTSRLAVACIDRNFQSSETRN